MDCLSNFRDLPCNLPSWGEIYDEVDSCLVKKKEDYLPTLQHEKDAAQAEFNRFFLLLNRF